MACGSCGKNNTPTGKLKSIYDGWKHLIWKDAETEKVANERALICAHCKRNKHEFCKECGCYLPAKIRSIDEKCPIAKW